MEKQNPTNSKLKPEQIDKINDELYWLEKTLLKIDSIRILQPQIKKEKQKAIFMNAFNGLYDQYTDMLDTGSEPGRAKFVMMKSLRDTLEQTTLNHLTKEPNETTQLI